MRQIDVPGYQGPLDLVVDFVEGQQLNITALSLVQITDQYWRHITSGRDMEPDVLAEFITIGSKLLHLKPPALLPSASPPDLRAEAEEVASNLTEMLEEHRRFKDAAELLRRLEEERRRAYVRTAPSRPLQLPLGLGLDGVTVDTLLEAVKEALSRKPLEPEEAVLHIESVTVNDKAEQIMKALHRRRGRLSFRSMLASCRTRTDIVVLFLAVLELIKAGKLWAEQ